MDKAVDGAANMEEQTLTDRMAGTTSAPCTYFFFHYPFAF
jgi:hypothetical protein